LRAGDLLTRDVGDAARGGGHLVRDRRRLRRGLPRGATQLDEFSRALPHATQAVREPLRARVDRRGGLSSHAAGVLHPRLEISLAETQRDTYDVVGETRLLLQVASHHDQHAGLEYHPRGVDRHDVVAHVIGEYEDGDAPLLQLVQDDVMHRDHHRTRDRHTPVAVHQQECQPAEDVEVHLDHATGLIDDQPRVQHDRRCDRHSGHELARGQSRAEHRDTAQQAADQQGGHPGATHRGEGQREREMPDEQPGEEPVGATVPVLEHRDPLAGSARAPVGQRRGRSPRPMRFALAR
jgi:hypothetical protein